MKFYIDMEQVNGDAGLFSQCARVFHFPNYFGFNWDALHECLRDQFGDDQKETEIEFFNVKNKQQSLIIEEFKEIADMINDEMGSKIEVKINNENTDI